MAEYKLNKPNPKHSNGDGYITKDGHTMFNEDIVRDLERIEELEEKVKKLQKFKINLHKELDEANELLYKNGLKVNPIQPNYKGA
jgi:hypothetical protein